MNILRKITYGLLFMMLFSPLLSYLTFGVLQIRPVDFYFQIFTIVFGFFFILINANRIKIPKYAVFALFWAIYLLIWSFINEEYERRSLLAIFLNNPSIAVFFILVIVRNTQFNHSFILNTIRIFKITVIVTAIVSVIQVVNNDFFNAWPQWMKESERFYFEGDIYSLRRVSIFGFIERNALGLSFIPLVSVLTGFMLHNRSRGMIVFLLSSAIAAFLSNTRYVMVGFLLLTIQLVNFYKIRVVGTLRYAIIISVIILISFQIINYLGYNIQAWSEERLFREGKITETTRFKAIGNFLYFFPKYPIFGNGNISDEEVVEASRAVGSSHIHVGYLSHLVAYGIVGCFFLFSFWFLLVKELYRNAKMTNYWGSFYAFLTFLWAFATFSQSSIFYYGLIFALVFDKYFTDNLQFYKQPFVSVRKLQ